MQQVITGGVRLSDKTNSKTTDGTKEQRSDGATVVMDKRKHPFPSSRRRVRETAPLPFFRDLTLAGFLENKGEVPGKTCDFRELFFLFWDASVIHETDTVINYLVIFLFYVL